MKSIRTSGHKAMIEAIIARRFELGLSQHSLAKHLGCTQSMVSSIENGQKRIDVIELLAISEALSIEPDYLLSIARTSMKSGELHTVFAARK